LCIFMSKSKPTELSVSMQQTPNLDQMINDSLRTIELEIIGYKTKVSKGQMLDPREAKVVQGYVESLVKLRREERESAREADLSQLSTDELVALLNNKNVKPLTGKVE